MNSAAADRSITQDSKWFVSWFDSAHYHKLYGDRDHREAAEFSDELIRRLRPVAGSAILDLGCGAGRHSRHLASRGFHVTGIDLAPGSIAQAARSQHRGRLRFVQQDMRVPFGRNAFDYVFSFFTSFGYFDEPSEHLTVVRNVARSLKQDGTLMLDYLNARHAERHLTTEEVRHIDGVVYRITRWTDTEHFFKRILIDEGQGVERLEYRERVAKFTLQDFERMFTSCGLRIEAVYGDYHLNAYDAQWSPRLVIVARKAGGSSLRNALLPREILTDAAECLGRQAEV